MSGENSLSHVVRNPVFAYVKTKSQIRCALTVQALSCYIDITIPLLSKAIFCSSTSRLVSDLVGNPEDRFSQEAAQCFSFFTFF